MESNETLAHVLERYSMCTTYSDAGTLTLDRKSGTPKITTLRTHFVRPNRVLLLLNADESDERIIWSNGAKVYEYKRKSCKRLTGGLFEFLNDGRLDDFFWFSAIPFLVPELQVAGTYLKSRFVAALDNLVYNLTAEYKPSARVQLSGSTADWSLSRITMEQEVRLGLRTIHAGNCITTQFDEVSFDKPVSDELFKFEPRQ